MILSCTKPAPSEMMPRPATPMIKASSKMFVLTAKNVKGPTFHERTRIVNVADLSALIITREKISFIER